VITAVPLIIGAPKLVYESYDSMCRGSLGRKLALDCGEDTGTAKPTSPAALSPAPVAQTPVEEVFGVTPASWGRDLTVTVRKARTNYKGSIVVFSCNPVSGHYGWIGETAFGSPSDDYLMAAEYEADSIVIGINVTPEDGDPKTVISTWNLRKLRQTKPPRSRPGTLQCVDFAGDP